MAAEELAGVAVAAAADAVVAGAVVVVAAVVVVVVVAVAHALEEVVGARGQDLGLAVAAVVADAWLSHLHYFRPAFHPFVGPTVAVYASACEDPRIPPQSWRFGTAPPPNVSPCVEACPSSRHSRLASVAAIVELFGHS